MAGEILKIEELRKIVIGEGEVLCVLHSAVKNFDFIEQLANELKTKIFIVDSFEDFRVISNKDLRV